MALYTEYIGDRRVHEPLGGREADGFDQWLAVTAANAAEARERLSQTLPLGAAGRYIAAGADNGYAAVLKGWKAAREGRTGASRHHFEVGLISAVMSAHGAAEYARQHCAGLEKTRGGRFVADITAEYLRSCVILAKYVGVSETAVAARGDDQAALSALRAGVAG